MDFRARAELAELMDAPGLEEAAYRRCLNDLASVNRVTFTHGATLRWLNRAARGLPPGAAFSVLDVAYGQGDLLRLVARWARRRGFNVRLSGIDLNPRSRAAAEAAGQGERIEFVTGNVFDYAPGEPPDFIVTSQFTHHLAEREIVQLLRWMDATAKRGWYIADLHRNRFAYHGFPLLARLMRWHEIVRSDGAVSIARSFRRAEWEAMLAKAGVQAQIRWHVPFRYSVSRLK